MTTHELDHYSATEIMGWPSDGPGSYYNLPMEFCNPEFDWHPSTSRDQLAMVIEKFYEWGRNCGDEWFFENLETALRGESLDAIGMRNPTKALEAIVGAHKATQVKT